MGDMADYYMEQYFLYDLENEGQHDREPLTVDSEWKTRDGQLIPVRNMTDGHLFNTIRVLRGKSPIGTRFLTSNVRRREWINVMANEAYRRGLKVDGPDEKDKVHE